MAQQSKNDGFGRPIHDASYNKIWAGKYTPQNISTTQNISTITGTTNQVNVTNNTKRDVTLSLPQSIDTNATPQFAGLSSQTNQSVRLGSGVGIGGNHCCFIGENSGQGSTGTAISCLGYQSGVNASDTSTMVGYFAGNNSAGLSHSIFGAKSGQGLTENSALCTYIGYGITPSSNTAQNEIVVGSSVSGQGSYTALIFAGRGVYTTNPSTAFFQYIGTNTQYTANSEILVETVVDSLSSFLTVVVGRITMGVAGYYQITVTASIAESTPNIPNSAFYLQHNYSNTIYKMFTQLNTPYQNISMTSILYLSQSDVIGVIYNRDFIFSNQSIITISVVFIGISPY